MNELDQARALLPFWVGWAGPVVYLLLVAMVTALGARVAIAIGLAGYAKASEAHWTERARRALPPRVLSSVCLFVLPGICAVYAHFWSGPLTLGGSRWLAVGALVTSLAVTTRAHFRLLQRVLPDPPGFTYWLKGAVTMLLVMRPILPFIVVMVFLAPQSLWTWAGAAWAAVGMLLLALMMGGATIPVGRLLGVVRRPSKRLQRVVAGAARRAGHCPRASYELVWPMANAAAYPMAGVLVFSDAALRVLDDDELEAIAAHELGHLNEPRSVKALRLLVAILWLPIAALRSIYDDHGVEGLAVVLGVTLVLFLVLRRVSRRMERRADAKAREQEPDPGSLARALEKIYQANGVPAVGWGRGTHPHLYDRMIAAGHEPTFPRPKPPARLRLYGGLLVALFLSMSLLFAASWTPTFFTCGDTDDEWPCLVWLASGSGGAWELAELGEQREARGQRGEAITFYRAAVVLAAEPSVELERLAVLLVMDQRCQEAAATVEQLRQLAERHLEAQEHLVYAAAVLQSCQSAAPTDPNLVDPAPAAPDPAAPVPPAPDPAPPAP